MFACPMEHVWKYCDLGGDAVAAICLFCVRSQIYQFCKANTFAFEFLFFCLARILRRSDLIGKIRPFQPHRQNCQRSTYIHMCEALPNLHTQYTYILCLTSQNNLEYILSALHVILQKCACTQCTSNCACSSTPLPLVH